ncbi:bifunctional DNA-formamidopyrimidine glycosylase/DNA-(apurinic or apyrimidinic site) lyase [Enhygromyxa salina]|uniref:Formamidopyrimidine-DNA glycosylase n=1 Tax=Enhygromyxa salina TaxID=215803 RepID=A0A2S9YLL4_9BACT|nr:bifunctional DNA-formamidopyrimidine glycosylase/DNA-(apurinic or apyrimidinic site) lyase [Enhygromyxa salina]PRQ05958.1 Formamidopyrimidine-DNA glycosylase [Enhygromyxa salina]
MPELPEVESVRRGIVRAKINAPVSSVWRSTQALRIGKHWRRELENLDILLGATPDQVRRRGKYLLWHMHPARGDAPLVLLIHLGMSGRCGVADPSQARVVHTHLVLSFADGRELRFVDPRRFGGLRAGTLDGIYGSDPIASLGPEPLERGFGGPTLERALGRSERALRDALLDQQAVAGIGNIYAIEACFEARLHPLLPARRLAPSAWQRLADAVQAALRRGIDNGGTTLKDFRNVTGKVGRNQDDLRVYGRADQPCPVCGAPLASFVHQGRSGVLCRRCQAKPRTRRVP